MPKQPKDAHDQALQSDAVQQQAVHSPDMKTCPFCKEQVRNDAIKCRYCQSMLLPPQLPEPTQPANDRVTYVLDQGLVRFAKFAGAILAIFLVVGAYLFGFKLEAGLERMQSVQERFTKAQADLAKTQEDFTKAQAALAKTQAEVTKAQADLVKTQGDVTRAQEEFETARQKVASLGKDFEAAVAALQERLQDRVRTVMTSTEVLVVAQGGSGLEQAARLIDARMLTLFRSVLTSDQYAALEKAINAPSRLQRQIYSAENRTALPGKPVRLEGQPPTGDAVVDQMYDNMGIVHEFFRAVFRRDLSLDAKGSVVASVHYGQKYNNAFWDGRQIVAGDGDGVLFKSGGFTSLGNVASQLAHIVIQRTAGLDYKGQSGALSNHMADVFSVLVEQWKQQEPADKASWLVGVELMQPDSKRIALRSMKMPGTAYDDPALGKDPQPAHMKDYKNLPVTFEGDHGGVHVNSGIPNRAFYEVAKGIGGNAWEAAGQIWFESLKSSSVRTDFQEFANTTYDVARKLYGSREQEAVKAGWEVVGITVGAR